MRDLQKIGLDLPVAEAIPTLEKALQDKGLAVLVAPPGAGKTTLVPIRLLGAHWRGEGTIILLEPRRLAARAAARRMASMLGEEVGQENLGQNAHSGRHRRRFRADGAG